MKSELWTEREEYLVSQLKPALSTRQIVSIFELLGFSRSVESIQKKAERLDVCYQEVKFVDGEFTKAEEVAIERIVEDEISVLSDITDLPSLEITKTKSPMNLLANLEEIRKSIKGNHNAIKDTVIPGEQLLQISTLMG